MMRNLRSCGKTWMIFLKSCVSGGWWSLWPANWQKFIELPRSEQWLLLQALLVLPLIGLGLRLLGLRRLQNLLSHCPLKKPGGASPEEVISTVAQAQARMVQVAARHGLYRATCLPPVAGPLVAPADVTGWKQICASG